MKISHKRSKVVSGACTVLSANNLEMQCVTLDVKCTVP